MVFMGKVFKRYLLAGSLPCLYGTKKCNTLPQKNAPPPYRKMWDIYRYYLHRLLTQTLSYHTSLGIQALKSLQDGGKDNGQHQ